MRHTAQSLKKNRRQNRRQTPSPPHVGNRILSRFRGSNAHRRTRLYEDEDSLAQVFRGGGHSNYVKSGAASDAPTVEDRAGRVSCEVLPLGNIIAIFTSRSNEMQENQTFGVEKGGQKHRATAEVEMF